MQKELDDIAARLAELPKGPFVKYKKLHPDAKVPSYAHHNDAGADICAVEKMWIPPGEWRLVKTGIAIELPVGYEAQVRPRSGLALKYGITVLNAPGTVDESYRGEVGVNLINHGVKDFLVTPGDRIAQLVVKPVTQAEFALVEELEDTVRGEGGFGSTGA
jgi:dUTP pyrophosphatase